MATKLIWKKEKGIGNVITEWTGYVGSPDGKDISVINVRVFKKGKFVLPVNWFPRSEKTGMCQTTKSIELAKKKCQKWWNEFIKYNQ